MSNVGAGATPNNTWQDAFYLSSTPTYNSQTAFLLGTLTSQGGLAADAGYTNTVAENIPNGLLSGRYYLLIDVDSTNAVFELNKTNNWMASTVQIPDLAVTAASVRPSVRQAPRCWSTGRLPTKMPPIL